MCEAWVAEIASTQEPVDAKVIAIVAVLNRRRGVRRSTCAHLAVRQPTGDEQ